MAIESGIPDLPKDGIIFLDSCAFGKDNPAPRDTKKEKYSINYIKKETARLEALTTQLSSMDNWCIIKEVLEEFKDGNLTFNYRIESSRVTQEKKAFERLLRQRKETLRLLEQEHVIADNSLVIELWDIINNITPLVERKFNTSKGKTNGKKTDTKLISLALAYAGQDFSFIFSQDQPLLKTFSDCAKDLYLYRTYIISDRFARPVTTRSYESELKRIRRVFQYS